MEYRSVTETRVIHPSVLKELPMEVIMELLKVAHDLRTGVIHPRQFDMKDFRSSIEIKGDEWDCGTAYCLAGWVAFRMNKNYRDLFYRGTNKNNNRGKDNGPAAEVFLDSNYEYYPPLRKLFFTHPSNPQMAADAVEQYVYHYAADPWKAAGYAASKA